MCSITEVLISSSYLLGRAGHAMVGTTQPMAMHRPSHNREVSILTIYLDVMSLYDPLFLNCCELAADFHCLKFIPHQLDRCIPGGSTSLGNLGFYALVKPAAAQVSGEAGY